MMTGASLGVGVRRRMRAGRASNPSVPRGRRPEGYLTVAPAWFELPLIPSVLTAATTY